MCCFEKYRRELTSDGVARGSGGGMEQNRNSLVDALKGICVLCVIVSHFGWRGSEWLKLLFPFWIDMAVPVFMVISGYVQFLSFEKHQIERFGQCYAAAFIVPKITRYSVPFLMTMAFQLLVKIARRSFSWNSVIAVFRGGEGAGSYYFPIMMQFLFMYPVIYFLIKRRGFKGLVVCFLLNALYEFFQRLWFVSGNCYRLLVFRYISVIAFGAYLASEKAGNGTISASAKRILGILSLAAGTAFLLLTQYMGYRPRIVIYWTSTCFLATLCVLPICAILLHKCAAFRCRALEAVGKASFNIYFAQMVWFTVPRFSQVLFADAGSRHRVIVLQNALNVAVCVCAGLVFYLIEQRITKRVVAAANARLR